MVNDSELLMLIHEKNEDALNILVSKYLPIIKIIAKKYRRMLNYLEISYDEVINEGIKGIEIAVDNYNDYKDASFKTYVSRIIDRNINYLIKRYNRNNYNILTNAIILNHKYDDNGILIDELASDIKNNPETKIILNEEINEVMLVLQQELSSLEYQVIMLKKDNVKDRDIANILKIDIKQVYNTIYRIRCKIKKYYEKNLK